jgi:hypothetical protein
MSHYNCTMWHQGHVIGCEVLAGSHDCWESMELSSTLQWAFLFHVEAQSLLPNYCQIPSGLQTLDAIAKVIPFPTLSCQAYPSSTLMMGSRNRAFTSGSDDWIQPKHGAFT